MIYEKNVIQKNLKGVDLRFGLCYPNVYRTAMSSLGYELLYNLINEDSGTFCERIIYPSTKSIETNSPMRDFNILSFSLQYEQDYFNVVKMLNDSGIPIKREDRDENDPLIIAGGPCATANPAPLAEFIDIFVIGEGEVVMGSLMDCYRENAKSMEDYCNIKGLYVSKFDNPTKIVKVPDMDKAYHITEPLISETENDEEKIVFDNSIMLNVSRGCTRGCRFCMSSYLYRPMRETSLSKLIETAKTARENSGLDKIVLIGAAVSDYSNINELISGLENEGFQISTPSLRLESITKEYLMTLKKSGLKTITIAPESIARLRKKINKEIDDEVILNVVKDAFDLGFNLKLYFLVGIPTETMDDMEKLVEFMKKIASYKKDNEIRFSVNPLVPKPHTPLQWETYDLKDIKRKMRYLKKEMRNYNIKLESPKNGMIQYILSCGNRGVSSIIEKSLTKKITLNEWKDHLPDYNLDSKLPWDNIDVGISRKYLKREFEKIEESENTPWCEVENCSGCGACSKNK